MFPGTGGGRREREKSRTTTKQLHANYFPKNLQVFLKK
jgi:hypothetical protein